MSVQSKKRRDLKMKAKKKKASNSFNKSIKLMRMISENYLDVLQNIEFVLVDGYRHDRSIDDCTVRDVLKALIYQKEYGDPRVQVLVNVLKEVRSTRDDISDAIWKAALRVVLDSVHTHSTLVPNTRGYLDFVSRYIP